MQIKAAELKAILKKLSGVNAANLSLDFSSGAVMASDTDLTVVVVSPLLKSDLAIFSVAAKQFSSIVNKLSGEITITRTTELVEVRSAKSRYELPASGQKTPTLPKPTKVWQVPLKVTREILQYASIASNRRKGLNFDYQAVVQLSPRGPESEHGITLRAVGTDGQRMAVGDAFVSLDRTDFRLLIPVAAIGLLNILDGDTLFIGETDTTIHFGVGNHEASTTIIARKQAKEFPDFEKAIPAAFAFSGQVGADEFRESLRKIEPVITDENRKLVLNFNGALKLAGGAEARAEDEIPYTQVDPDPIFEEAKFRVQLNHAFLSEFAESVNENIRISGTTPLEPVWLQSGNRKLLVAAIR